MGERQGERGGGLRGFPRRESDVFGGRCQERIPLDHLPQFGDRSSYAFDFESCSRGFSCQVLPNRATAKGSIIARLTSVPSLGPSGAAANTSHVLNTAAVLSTALFWPVLVIDSDHRTTRRCIRLSKVAFRL